MGEFKPGQVSFLEIGSADAGATRAFFGAVFDWPVHDDAWLQTPHLKAGTHSPDPSPQVYVYFNVADLDAAAARIRAAGGQAEPSVEEPGFGRFVQCVDPAGVRFGLHQEIE